MRKIFIAVAGAFLAAGLFAQNQTGSEGGQSEEELELPDVTTVVSGGDIKAGKDAVPDYTRILPKQDTAKVELPKMDSDKMKLDSKGSDENAGIGERSVYAEGQLGGGYPFYFLGDFSIYRASGEEPFSINFRHESTEGFASKDPAEGYFERNTSISGIKTYSSKTGKHNISGYYKSSDDGLQSKSAKLDDQVKHTLGGNFVSRWNLPKGFNLYYGFEGNWYSRYSGLEKGLNVPENELAQSETSIFYAKPFFGTGYEKGKFGINLLMEYETQLNLGENDAFAQDDGTLLDQSTHRGSFVLSSSWENSLVTLWGNAGIVVGNSLNGSSVVPPFAVGTNWRINAFASERLLLINAEGGLVSRQDQIQSLETKYKYSFIGELPLETSDWYGKFQFSMPVENVLTLSGGIEYRKTAFDNGIWMVDYSGKRTDGYGLYSLTYEAQEQINTNLSVEFSLYDFQFAGLWNSCWKDMDSLSEKQSFVMTALYQSKDARWNALLKAGMFIGDKADKTPEISGNLALRVSPSIRLALEVDDIVKLITSETRKYAHSSFVDKSGTVALLAKFQF